MFFRRLNWNVVGWLRTVSIISYAIIALGIASMIYHWVTTGTPLRLGLSFTGGTDVTVKFAHAGRPRRDRQGAGRHRVTDAQINTLNKPGEPVGERYTIETQTDFGNVTDPLWNALGTVARSTARSRRSRPSARRSRREYLLNALKALVIAIAIQFIYIAFRFGWNYIFGLGDDHRARARLGDDDRHLLAREQARRRRVPRRRADRHRLFGHGHDRDPRPDPREHQDHGRRAVRQDRQHVDPADDDALGQHARDRRHHAGRAAGVRRRVAAEFRLRAAGRHLLGRLPLDLLLGAARGVVPEAHGRARRARAGPRSKRSRARSPKRARRRAREADRAEILAARKARRERERQSSRADARRTAEVQAPPRSKRPTTRSCSRRRSRTITTTLRDEEYDELDLERETYEADDRSARRADARPSRSRLRTRPRRDSAEPRRGRRASRTAAPARETPHTN